MVLELSIVSIKDNGTILDKVLSLNALVFTFDVQIGTFGLQTNGYESSSCEPGRSTIHSGGEKLFLEALKLASLVRTLCY